MKTLKEVLNALFYSLFRRCPYGKLHPFWVQVCQCRNGRPYDLMHNQQMNGHVKKGDWVQPDGLALKEPLAWRVIGFISRMKNPKYKVVIEHPISRDTLALENVPHNTLPANMVPDEDFLKKRRELYKYNQENSAGMSFT